MSNEKTIVVSETPTHREIVIISEGIGKKKRGGGPRMLSRTVHQSKVNGNWQNTTRKGRGYIEPPHVKAAKARKKAVIESEED